MDGGYKLLLSHHKFGLRHGMVMPPGFFHYVAGYGSADVLLLKETEKPQLSSDGPQNEVLPRVYATAVMRADTMMRRGIPFYSRLFLGLTKPKKEIPGTAFSAVVEAAGAAVRRFNVGDVVFGETGMAFAANAEYLRLSEDAVIAKKPEKLDHKQAACICDGLLTSYGFLNGHSLGEKKESRMGKRCGRQFGQCRGADGKIVGATVTAVCGAGNADFVRSLGADVVLNDATTDFTANSYNIVYDTVGKSAFSRYQRSLSAHGVYLSPVFYMLATAKSGGKKAIFSATGLRPPLKLQQMLTKIMGLLQENKLQIVVSKCYRFDQLPQAHRHVDGRHKQANVVAVFKMMKNKHAADRSVLRPPLFPHIGVGGMATAQFGQKGF